MAIASTFAGLWSLGVAVYQLLPAPAPPLDVGEVADQLASSVREQWTEEARARQLREPRVIPLSWAATERQVAASPETVLGTRAGRVLRMSLEGRLEGNFSTASAQLADGYDRIPSGRLVVLGEPGGGKTVLALMLTLGLLAQRSPQSPVPVLLSVSSWDPVSESLDDWITSTLAAQYYGGQTHAPRLLLNQQMLLPVLDGLDEIPESARRNAVRGLNTASSDGRGLVLTCRSAEYQDVIEGGSPPLRRASVVEVAPVPVTDAVNFLEEVDWPEGVSWAPVHAHMREQPEGAAATALSTPLTLSLARAVYQHCNRDPAELLDFDSRHAVEDHLIDHIIPAAYAPAPGSTAEQTDGAWQQEAQQAEKYLTFLATYLHRYRERDFAWWRMSGRLFSRWAGLVVGLGLGLFTMLVVSVVLKPLGVDGATEWPVVLGVGVAVLAMLTWYAAPDRPPGRVSFALRGSLRRLRAGFGTGFALTSLLAVTVFGTRAVITTYDGDWNVEELAELFQIAAFAVGVAITIGVAFAVHEWLDTPPEHSTRATPVDLLDQDRNSSLVGTGLAGVIFGAIAFPLLVTTVSLAFLVFLALTGWSGEPWPTDILAQVTHEVGEDDSLPYILRVTVLPGAVFTALALLHRAWTRFALLRVFLAARGQVPWHFVRFLSDARDRQLLRQSGGTYQFRHIRLQERLASRSLARDRIPVPQAQIIRRRRIKLATIGAVLVVACLLVSKVMPDDTSRMTLPTGDVEAMGFGPPDTHTFITARADGTVQRWNTKTGKKVGERRVDFIAGIEVYQISMTAEAGTGEMLIIDGYAYEDNGRWRVPWGQSRRITKKQVKSVGGTVSVDLPEPYRITRDEDVYCDYEPGVKGEKGGVSTYRLDGMGVSRPAGGKHVFDNSDPQGNWDIGPSGKWFVATSKLNAQGWDAQCEMDWSVKTYKEFDDFAVDEEGAKLALKFGSLTRIYDTSKL